MGKGHREMAREKIENGISCSGENRVVEGAELAAFGPLISLARTS